MHGQSECGRGKALLTMKRPFLTDTDAHRFTEVFEFVKRITARDFDVTSLGSDKMREWDAKFDETLREILGCK